MGGDGADVAAQQAAAMGRVVEAQNRVMKLEREKAALQTEGNKAAIATKQKELALSQEAFSLADKRAKAGRSQYNSQVEQLAKMDPVQGRLTAEALNKARNGEQLNNQEAERLRGFNSPDGAKAVRAHDEKRVRARGGAQADLLDRTQRMAEGAEADAAKLKIEVADIKQELTVKLTADGAKIATQLAGTLAKMMQEQFDLIKAGDADDIKAHEVTISEAS